MATYTTYVTNNIPNSTVVETTYDESTGYWTFKVTANDGYVFDPDTTPIKVTYWNTYGYFRSTTLTVSDDGKTATATENFRVDASTGSSKTQPFTYVGATKESGEPVEPTITNNVANSEASYEGTNPYTLTVVASDGYKFDTSPTATYTDSDGNEQTDTFQLSSDSKTATLTTSTVLSTALAITINGTTTPETVTPTFTNNIEHTTFTYSGSDHQYTVKITCDTGYIFDGTPEASYTGYSSDQPVSVSFSVSSDSKTANGVLPDVDENTPIVLTGNTTTPVTKTTTVKTSLTNCTVDGTLPDSITGGESLSVTLKANENTHFEKIPKFSWFDESGYIQTQELTISEDTLTATGTFVNPSYVPDDVTVNGTATPDTVIGDNYGAINVYKVSLDNLEAFSKKRFFKETEDDGSVTLINLGDYVNRIKRLFFTVPTASTDVIKCGNYNTGVECEAPNTDTVTLNFGNITVPTPNGDTTDFLCELQMFVPFKGFVSIPVDYVGKTLSIVYTVNVITGGGVAKVMCGDDVVMLVDVEPNEDIIYQTNLDNLATIGGTQWNEEILYGIEPYLYVKYYDSLNKEERNNDYVNAKLGDLSGFCVVSDITLNTNDEMTANEQETIITLLKQGVYIG